jgi:hypothetical protein
MFANSTQTVYASTAAHLHNALAKPPIAILLLPTSLPHTPAATHHCNCYGFTWVVVAAHGVLMAWMAHHWLLGALVLLVRGAQAHLRLQMCALGLLLLPGPPPDPAHISLVAVLCDKGGVESYRRHAVMLTSRQVCQAVLLDQGNKAPARQQPGTMIAKSSTVHLCCQALRRQLQLQLLPKRT